MIYCAISIDYLSQLERSGHREPKALIQNLRTMAADLGGGSAAKDQPLLLVFPEKGPFAGILAAEAVRRAVAQLASAAPSLRGFGVYVHRSESAEAALDTIANIRAVSIARTYSITAEAREYLSAYLPPPGNDPLAWDNPLYDTMLNDADLSAITARPGIGAKIMEALGADDARMVVLQSGNAVLSAAMLARELASATGNTVLSMSGRKTNSRPYAPFTELVQPPSDQADGDSPDALGCAFRLAALSLGARGLPDAIAKGCEVYIGRTLDQQGPALVLCENTEQFSPEASALIASRLERGRGSERYIVVSNSGVPDAWRRTRSVRMTIAEPKATDLDKAIGLALGASQNPVRDRLERRARALVSGSESESGVLVALPREMTLFLYGTLCVQGLLDREEASRFFLELGLPPEGVQLITSILVRSGHLDPEDPCKVLGVMNMAQLAVLAGKQSAVLLEEKLDSFLVDKYRHGSIRPSIAFLKRVGERPEEERLVLDCLFEEAFCSTEPIKTDKGFLSASSASLLGFWRAMHRRDRSAAEAAAIRCSERMEGSRSAALKAMVKAELSYASGDGERSSIHAREALLALGRGAPPKLEARAHRMMGLAALAAERYVEAVDYLTNAQELSETSGIQYERMMAAYARALAEFMTGSLGKAMRASQQAAESAASIFRVDAQAAIESLLGRMDMELGAYDEAARRYQAMHAFCQTYGLEEAAVRASAWRGRALSYAGAYDDACAVLDRLADDPEARVFRGELEILRGRPRDARPWLEEPGLPPARGFRPPDAFEWAGSLAEIEGRCLGFSNADGALTDMRHALSWFARGLDSRDPEAAVQLYELTRSQRAGTPNPNMGTYSFFCYLLEERLAQPPVDKQTVLSRAFKALQQRAGRIEDRAQRALFMEKNAWNRRLIEAARAHKFI